MPYLTQIQIENFRNIQHIKIQPAKKFNIIFGKNGCGKTSFLEALYFLAYSKSFRTTHLKNLIQQEQFFHRILLHVCISSATGEEEEILVATERNLEGDKKLRLNHTDQNSLAEVAKALPFLLTTSQSYRLFIDGPKLRRQFLDWGLFHVKQSFFPLWRQLQLALRQRNALLKQTKNLFYSDVAIWDEQIAHYGEEINSLREDYIANLTPIFNQLVTTLLPQFEIQLRFTRGWSQKHSLKEALYESWQQDLALGHTRCGPQRADLQCYIYHQPVQEHLSQGQLKLAAYALYLAQGLLFKQSTHASPIYLIDDLPSELDPVKRRLVCQTLKNIDGQIFITAISPEDVQDMMANEKYEAINLEEMLASC